MTGTASCKSQTAAAPPRCHETAVHTYSQMQSTMKTLHYTKKWIQCRAQKNVTKLHSDVNFPSLIIRNKMYFD